MSDNKPYVSASQLELYWRCGEAYRRRYVEKEIIPPGFALLVGTGLHCGAEHNFRQKIDSHVDLPVDDIVDAAVGGFLARVYKDGFELTTEEQAIGSKKTLAQHQDLVADLAELHALEQAPDYQPTAVEKSTLIELPGSRDLLTITDLRDTEGRVVDLKTALRKKNQREVDSSTALTAYAAAYRADHGVDPTAVRLDTMLKSKSRERQVLESTRDETDYAVLAARIDTTVAAIDAGVFPPASPMSWQCSEKWCGYARTCPYYIPEKKRG